MCSCPITLRFANLWSLEAGVFSRFVFRAGYIGCGDDDGERGITNSDCNASRDLYLKTKAARGLSLPLGICILGDGALSTSAPGTKLGSHQ